MIRFAEAVLALSPNAQFTTNGESIIEWQGDDPQPTDEEITRKIAELEYEQEIKEYQEKRRRAYPPMQEQLDKIFHEGLDAWKADVQAVKDAFPKVEVDEVEKQKRGEDAWNAKLFNTQLEAYEKAVKRLALVEKAVGREEVPEVVKEVLVEDWDENGIQKTMTVVSERAIPAIDPIEATVTYVDEDGAEQTIENPVITKDNEERAAAQAIIDSTPQEVIDAYNQENTQ